MNITFQFFTRSLFIFGFVVLCVSACRREPASVAAEVIPEWPAFDGHAAYEDVVNLTGFGSRAQGSDGNRHAAHYILARLKSMNLNPAFQLFTNQTVAGEIIFRNIETIIPGTSTGMILVTTHYDSLYHAPEDFQAANSAGSGPAVLLEVARVLQAGYDGKGPEIRLVFFDGQEPLTRHSQSDGLRGSKYYAKHLIDNQRQNGVIALINLDMVGDRDLTITLPRNISSFLRRKLLDAAHRENARSYFSLFPAEIGDDHDPFHQLKIPAINLIDFQFGSAPGRNDYWQTPGDTLDKISPDSLEITGRVTLRLIRDLFPAR